MFEILTFWGVPPPQTNTSLWLHFREKGFLIEFD